MKHAEALQIVGHVRGYETDLDNNIIPGTEFEDHNTIFTNLKQYLAESIATDVDEAINNFFTGYVASTEVTAGRTDGIGYSEDQNDEDVEDTFITVLNVGGDGTETYAEFYGYIEGAITMNGYLLLGHGLALDTGDYKFATPYASYAINKTVAANRRYHFYWKITIG